MAATIRRVARPIATSAVVVLSILMLLPATAMGTVHQISVSNSSFTPDDITIVPGDTVRWTALTGSHRIHSDTDSFNDWDSGLLDPTSSPYDLIFGLADSLGPFNYLCTFHQNRGTIRLADTCWATGTLNDSLPLTVADLVYMVRVIGGDIPPPDNLYRLDLTGDCVVDSSDGQLLTNYFIFGPESLSVYPMPTCCFPELDTSSTVILQRLSLDSVTGLCCGDTIYTYRPITFHIRLTNITPDDYVVALLNGFRLYSPTGGGWSGLTGGYTDAVPDWMMAGKHVHTFGANGSGWDTVAFFAAGTGWNGGYGIVNDFDDIALTIHLEPFDSLAEGHVLCLDSTALPFLFMPGMDDWNWDLGYGDVLTGNAAPGWDGPHCFTLVNPPCELAATGDVNLDTQLTSADIIYLVNYAFKGGVDPLPCAAAADVNCDGAVTSADIIFSVNHIFKTGPAPCNACALIWSGAWDCP